MKIAILYVVFIFLVAWVGFHLGESIVNNVQMLIQKVKQ